MFLHVLKTNDVLINILADLKAAVAAVRRLTVSATSSVAINTENVFLVFLKGLMFNTKIKELALQQCIKPITCFLLLNYKFTSNLQSTKTKFIIWTQSNQSNYARNWKTVSRVEFRTLNFVFSKQKLQNLVADSEFVVSKHNRISLEQEFKPISANKSSL